MNGSTIDAVDRAIIYHLQENARKPITDIADAVNVADNTVRNRIQKLEDEGIIRGYTATVDYDKANVQHYYIFICTARVSEREELAEEARKHSSIVEVLTLMTGTNNIYVLGVGTRKDDMTNLAYSLDNLGLRIDHEHLIRDHVHEPFDGFRLEQNI